MPQLIKTMSRLYLLIKTSKSAGPLIGKVTDRLELVGRRRTNSSVRCDSSDNHGAICLLDKGALERGGD